MKLSNNIVRILLTIPLIIATQSNADNCACTTECTTGHSMYIPRSADSNTAYYYVSNICSQQTTRCWGGLNVGFEYQRSFHGENIAECMFGKTTLSFKGSRTAGRDSNRDILADYFGLSPDFNESITFHPRIQNFNVHAQEIVELDCWLPGLYGQVQCTFSHQSRKLIDDSNCTCCSACQAELLNTGTSPFPAGYMAPTTIVASQNIKKALSGENTFGDMQTPWSFGKFDFCKRSKNKIAGVDIILGYNFLRAECGHFGVYCIYCAPTGNKSNPKYVFDAVVGNGKHHELGGGITSQYELWNNGYDQSIIAYLDGYATHLFENCQLRSFDFANKGCMSRYMLLKKMTATTTDFAYDYTGSNGLINAIDFTTRHTRVKIAVKGDATVAFVYKNSDWSIGLGYNLYGHSKEKLHLYSDIPCNTIDPQAFYAFKGCTGVYGFAYDYDGGNLITAHNTTFTRTLNTTATNATIKSCASADNAVAYDTVSPIVVGWENSYAGNGRAANDIIDGTSKTVLSEAMLSQPAIAYAYDLRSSETLLNIASGKSPQQMTHKGFVTIEHSWNNCHLQPYIAMGGEVEGSSSCRDHRQWGIWFKSGISF